MTPRQQRRVIERAHDVAAVGAAHRALQTEGLRRGAAARVEPTGDDADGDAFSERSTHRADVTRVRDAVRIEERAVEIDREELLGRRHERRGRAQVCA
jgi:hypothetical protein